MSTTPTKAKAPAKPAAKAQKLDLKELQARQLSDEASEQQTGNTDDDYAFPAHEADRVHVRLSRKVNDPVKKEYVEETKTVKLVPTQFERMDKNGSFAEYDSVTILHDPRPKAAAKSATEPAEPGQQKEPQQPVSTLPTLQDAQMRYQELYPEEKELTASKSYDELVELIKAKDADFGKDA